jgi:drug/metabolite transporter (DMT)-like permease
LTRDAQRSAGAGGAGGAGGAHGVDRADGASGTDFPPKALAWTLLAGALTSAYVLSDAQGARAGGADASVASGPLAYGLAVSVTNGLAMSWVSRRVGAPWVLLARHWRLVVPLSLASMVSYLLILWVFTQAPVAPAAALRDTSAFFAVLIAVLWLKERLRPWRLLALALVVAGVPLLRLG